MNDLTFDLCQKKLTKEQKNTSNIQKTIQRQNIYDHIKRFSLWKLMRETMRNDCDFICNWRKRKKKDEKKPQINGNQKWLWQKYNEN